MWSLRLQSVGLSTSTRIITKMGEHPRRRTEQPNFLIIVLDATRADACSCYGAAQETTPHLDRLAEEGVLFEQAISPAPWTLPAMMSMLTGLFPNQTDIYQTRRLDTHIPTLPALLSDHGYATFAVTNNSWLSPAFGLIRGFQKLHKLWQLIQVDDDITMVNVTEDAPDKSLYQAALQRLLRGNPAINALNYLFYRRVQKVDYGASRTLAPLRKWVDTLDDGRPWFALVHFLEAHLEYKPPLQWLERFARDRQRALRLLHSDQRRIFWQHNAGVAHLTEEDLRAWQDLYLAEVAYQDYYLGQILKWLDENGHRENTCVIVVADHGENLGEHGLLNHQYCLYDTLIRVPLVVSWPSVLPNGTRVLHQVQTLDVFQTVLDMAGIEPPHPYSKTLLAPTGRAHTFAVYGRPRPPRPSILQKYNISPEQLQRFERGLTAVRSDNYKLIRSEQDVAELYAWRDDPFEENNLAAVHPEVVAELSGVLRAWEHELHAQGALSVPQDADSMQLDPLLAARLRSLGYLD